MCQSVCITMESPQDTPVATSTLTAESPKVHSKMPTSCWAFLKNNEDRIIILVVCFWINVQAAATISCLGVLLVEFMEYYNVPRTAVTWVAGTHMGVSIIVGPMVGVLLKSFGSRSVGMVFALLSGTGYVLAAFINNLTSLYFTFGLMAGMGPCCYYAIANSTVQHYFIKRRALACTVILTAFSIGGFAWPPFCHWLISIYCWQGALLIIGGLHIQLLVAFMLLGIMEKRAKNQRKLEVYSEKPGVLPKAVAENCGNKLHLTMKEAQPLRNGQVIEQYGSMENVGEMYNHKRQKRSMCHCLLSWLCLTFIYSAGVCFGMILYAGVLVYTPVRSWQLGISKDQGAILVSIISAAGGFCRIPAGLLGDLRCMNRGLLLASSIGISGVLAFLSQFVTTFITLAFFSAVYGSIIAVYLALQTVVLSDLAGMEHLPVAMGILLAGHGLSSLLLHPIAGALMDLTGSANTVFIAVSFVGMIGGGLVTIVIALKALDRRKQNKHNRDTKDREEGCALEPLRNVGEEHVTQDTHRQAEVS